MLPPLTADRIEGIEAIEAAIPRWRALAAARSRNRPFSGPGFVMAALKTYHRHENPAIWVVERGNDLEAALPLISRPLARFGLRINEMGFPRNPNVILNDPLFPPGSDPEARVAVLRCLFAELRRERCCTLILDHLPGADNLPATLAQVAAEFGFGLDEPVQARSLCYIAADGSLEDYLASRSSDHRWQMKKIARRARGAGSAIEVLRTRESISAALEVWFEIERQSWQGSTPGAAMTEIDRAFSRQLLVDLDDDEVGELYLLQIAGVPAAALRMIGSAKRTCVHTMHFAQAFKHLSPGSLLLEAMLRSAFERGVEEVDLHGNSAFFQRWATGERSHYTLRIYKPGLYGRLLQTGRRWARSIEAKRATALALPNDRGGGII